MKPDYRISIAITALLIVVALLIPPWKDQFNGQFVDFYYVFSEEIPKIKWVGNSPIRVNIEIDYVRLAIEIIGIILIMLAIHLLMLVPFVAVFFEKVQTFIKVILKPVNLVFSFLSEYHFLIKWIALIAVIILGYE